MRNTESLNTKIIKLGCLEMDHSMLYHNTIMHSPMIYIPKSHVLEPVAEEAGKSGEAQV